eukprot:5780661-Pleurochrysis_carterae.AAC.1
MEVTMEVEVTAAALAAAVHVAAVAAVRRTTTVAHESDACGARDGDCGDGCGRRALCAADAHRVVHDIAQCAVLAVDKAPRLIARRRRAVESVDRAAGGRPELQVPEAAERADGARSKQANRAEARAERWVGREWRRRRRWWRRRPRR